ncbi:MAG: ThuA domain-containing protein [bacterium]|nr:ThuA domain-containing protein [bacterium]
MKKESKKLTKPRILLICGDYWHAPACADFVIHGLCEELDYSLTSVFSHYDVPWDDFMNFNALILYKEGRYSQHDDETRWLTLAQEQQLVNFTFKGGSFLGLHPGVCSYAQEGPMRNMMKGHFVRHPPELSYKVLPKEGHLFCRDIEPFDVFDELYITDVSAENTEVFLESEAPEEGKVISGWMHQYGAGKFIGLTPGHTVKVMAHPMMKALLKNILGEL